MEDPSAIATDTRVGSLVDGRYRVLEAMAAGSMGAVYKAERVPVGKLVAIKFLHAPFATDSEFLGRFERETRVMSKLTHPNCVSVVDFGVWDGAPYLVMEYVSGTTLRALLDQGGALPARRALGLARQIAAGLAHAHAQGIVHRDVKPANIMISDEIGTGDHVRILDFGLARLRGAVGRDATHSNVVVGTPNYMAPEQTVGGGLIDLRTDIYAVGVVLFELVCGERPFHAEDTLALLGMHRAAPIPKLADRVRDGVVAPRGLQAIIDKAMAKSPADRFQSAIELTEAIDEVVASNFGSGSGIRASSGDRSRHGTDARRAGNAPTVLAVVDADRTELPVQRARSQPRRGLLGSLAFLVALIGGVGLAAWWLQPRSDETQAAPNSNAATATTKQPAVPPASPTDPNASAAAVDLARTGSGSAGGSAGPAAAADPTGSASTTGVPAAPAASDSAANVGSPAGSASPGGSGGDATGSNGAVAVASPGSASAAAALAGTITPSGSGSSGSSGSALGSGAASATAPTANPTSADSPSATATTAAASTAGGPGAAATANPDSAAPPTAPTPSASIKTSTNPTGASTGARRETSTAGAGSADRSRTGKPAAPCDGSPCSDIEIDPATAEDPAPPSAKPAADDEAANAPRSAAEADRVERRVSAAPSTPALATTVAAAVQLIKEGKHDQALASLRTLWKKTPNSSSIPFLLGNLYYDQRWWSVAMDHYSAAIKKNAKYRTNPAINRNVIRMLATDKTARRAEGFLKYIIGKPALPYVKYAAQHDSNAQVKRLSTWLARAM